MVSNTRVDITLCLDEDIPECFEVLSKSFGHNAPLIDIYYPNHDTVPGQAKGSDRLLTWKKFAKDSAFLKAVLHASPGEQEQIIGFAIWTHMKEAPPADIAKIENIVDVWPDEMDREFISRIWEQYVGPRTEAITQAGGRGIFVLEMLAVHPDYQRQGAGTALVEWGMNSADEHKVEAVVEGTPVGRQLYEKCGFLAEIEKMRFDVGEHFNNRKKPELVFLKRTSKA